MATDIKAPQFPESVADGTVATWHKQEGEAVKRDELLVDIETDKVVLEVVAPADGVVSKILAGEGDTVESQQVLGHFEEGASGGAAPSGEKADSAPAEEEKEEPAEAPAKASESASDDDSASDQAGPAARKLMTEHGVAAEQVTGTGKGGRITKADVEKTISAKEEKRASPPAPQQPATVDVPATPGEREERRVPMTRLRKRIAERLVSAQQNSAMLTTFNEVNMKPIMDMRKHYQPEFEKAHNVRLGFMGFFTRACVEALKRFPAVNASIDGEDIVYHGYYDVGVAVSTERGLVVPVIRDADKKSVKDIAVDMQTLSEKARAKKPTPGDLPSALFSIVRLGGIGGTAFTPIVNWPEVSILGVSRSQMKPVFNGEGFDPRLMLPLSLSYDHRVIDGADAARFTTYLSALLADIRRLLL